MRNRVVQKSMFTDYAAITISPEAKLFLIGLMTVSDDMGDCTADVKYLKSKCVIKMGQTEDDIRGWIETLVEAGELRYEMDGKLLVVIGWDDKTSRTFQSIPTNRIQAWRWRSKLSAVIEETSEVEDTRIEEAAPISRPLKKFVKPAQKAVEPKKTLNPRTTKGEVPKKALRPSQGIKKAPVIEPMPEKKLRVRSIADIPVLGGGKKVPRIKTVNARIQRYLQMGDIVALRDVPLIELEEAFKESIFNIEQMREIAGERPFLKQFLPVVAAYTGMGIKKKVTKPLVKKIIAAKVAKKEEDFDPEIWALQPMKEILVANKNGELTDDQFDEVLEARDKMPPEFHARMKREAAERDIRERTEKARKRLGFRYDEEDDQ